MLRNFLKALLVVTIVFVTPDTMQAQAFKKIANVSSRPSSRKGGGSKLRLLRKNKSKMYRSPQKAYRVRRSSPHRSKLWFKRANRRQRTRVPRGDRSWLRSNRLRN